MQETGSWFVLALFTQLHTSSLRCNVSFRQYGVLFCESNYRTFSAVMSYLTEESDGKKLLKVLVYHRQQHIEHVNLLQTLPQCYCNAQILQYRPPFVPLIASNVVSAFYCQLMLMCFKYCTTCQRRQKETLKIYARKKKRRRDNNEIQYERLRWRQSTV